MSNCKSLNLKIYTDLYYEFDIDILSTNVNGICQTVNNFKVDGINDFNIITEREKTTEGILQNNYKIQIKDNVTGSGESFSLRLGINTFCHQFKIVPGFGRILRIDLTEDTSITSSNVSYNSGESSFINSICPPNSFSTAIGMTRFYYQNF